VCVRDLDVLRLVGDDAEEGSSVPPIEWPTDDPAVPLIVADPTILDAAIRACSSLAEWESAEDARGVHAGRIDSSFVSTPSAWSVTVATPFFGLILVFIVIALVAGFIANFLVGKGKGFETWELFVAGIIGSFVGGTLLNLVFEGDLDFSISGIIGSTIGAIIVLAIWGWFRTRMKTA
jgi:uncharacterized membrane protein YeaQ/YmgE (transglycosylase-associated protein family)